MRGLQAGSDPERRASQPRSWNQLRWLLIVTFVSLALLPLMFVVPLTFTQVRAQATAQVTDQLQAISDLKASQIRRWIDDSHTALRFILSEPTRAQLEPIFSVAPSDTQLAERSRLLAQLVTGADESQKALFTQLFIYDREGNVLVASDPRQIGKIVQRQPYFSASLEQAFTQAPYYAVGTGELTMIITEPIRGLDGTLKGVLAGELNLDTLAGLMIERAGLGESGETYLVSAENSYLLTPSRFEGYPVNRSYRSVGIDRALQQQSGSGLYDDYRDPPVPVIGVYRWIPELQAALISEMDQAEISRKFTQAIQLIGVVAFVAAAGAVGLGFFVATRIAGPISALTKAALRITDGDLSQRAQESSGSDEIRLLTRTFNRMTAQLQETLAGLEQRVAERTQELEAINREQQGLLAQLQASLQERDALSATILELSSPVLPVAEGVLVMPLVGVIDSQRAVALSAALLQAIERNRARTIILDVTGVPIIDTQTARILMQVADASRLLGAQTVLVGIRPELAQTIVGLGVELPSMVSMADLQSALRYVLRQQ